MRCKDPRSLGGVQQHLVGFSHNPTITVAPVFASEGPFTRLVGDGRLNAGWDEAAWARIVPASRRTHPPQMGADRMAVFVSSGACRSRRAMLERDTTREPMCWITPSASTRQSVVIDDRMPEPMEFQG